MLPMLRCTASSTVLLLLFTLARADTDVQFRYTLTVKDWEGHTATMV